MSSDLGPLGRLNIFVDRGEAAMDMDLDGDLGPGREDAPMSTGMNDLDINLSNSTRGLRFDAPIDSRGSRMGMDMKAGSDMATARDVGVTPNRTDNFDLSTGQFRDPDTGAFEPGGAPPDFDPGPDRFRAKSGEFKSSPADHFDEPAEVRQNSLEPKG